MKQKLSGRDRILNGCKLAKLMQECSFISTINLTQAVYTLAGKKIMILQIIQSYT